MKQEQAWSYLVERNPKLLTGGAMSAENYRRFFDWVWREAQVEMRQEFGKITDDGVPDFLKGLFNHRRR